MLSTNSLQKTTNNLLNWFLDDRSLCLENDGSHRPYEIAKQISDTYMHLEFFKSESKEIRILKPKIYNSEEFLEGDDREFLKLVDDMANYINSFLSEYIETFLLHGSFGTKDYSKGWSDIDSFMVIRTNTIESTDKLVELRKKCLFLRNKFYQICPLQHHGIMTYTNYDLKNYLPGFLPLQSLEKSQALFFDQKIQFNIIQNEKIEKYPGLGRIKYIYKLTNEALAEGEFLHHPHNGVGLKVDYKNCENAMRQLFWFLGTIMTMPAYLLTAINKSTNKKKSFEVAKKYYSDESWSLIEDATKIRLLWGINQGVEYSGNKIPEWLIENFKNNYMQRFNTLLKESILIIENSDFFN